MIINSDRYQNFNAASAVDVDGEQKIILTMSAAVPQEMDINFSYAIRDRDLYKEHSDTADEDFREFKEYVLSQI